MANRELTKRNGILTIFAVVFTLSVATYSIVDFTKWPSVFVGVCIAIMACLDKNKKSWNWFWFRCLCLTALSLFLILTTANMSFTVFAHNIVYVLGSGYAFVLVYVLVDIVLTVRKINRERFISIDSID